MKTKITTSLYFILLAMIVYAANRGTLPKYISFYREIPFGDTLGHFILMGILSFFATILSKRHRVAVAGVSVPIGPILVFVIVFIEEVSQIFIATRTFSLTDLSADICGIITFAFLGLKLVNGSSAEDTDKVPVSDSNNEFSE